MNWTQLNYDKQSSGSHLPVLEMLFHIRPIKRVLEFGVGGFSTDFFNGKNIELVSVDDGKEWLDKFCDKSNPRHRQLLASANDMHKVLTGDLDGKFFDLIFVDCAWQSRAPCAQSSFNRSEIIVWHDTQGGQYRWETVKIPETYQRFDFKFAPSWTSVLTNNKDVAEKVGYWLGVFNDYKRLYNLISII